MKSATFLCLFLKGENMVRKVMKTDKAPAALGPYSVAIQTDKMVFTSGQVGIDPVSNEMVDGGIEGQTRQVLTNLKNVLEASGSGLDYVVKTTVFLQDMSDFSKMNAIYGEFFEKDPPARSTVAVAGLPKGALVEIETTALLNNS
jgi:2-iminobutanoate/2-iminopropanoate deaminase